MATKSKVYINGRLIGFHPNPAKLKTELIEKRRKNELSSHINISFDEKTNEVYINTDAGRIQRPVIVVKNGKPMFTAEHLQKIKNKEITWDKLLEEGVIEYIDAEEEENTLIAVDEESLTKEHTHIEIDGVGTLSVITSLIPYLEHDMGGKVLHGAKMFKQAQGINGINYNLRTDTEGYLLYYPQIPLVKSKSYDLLNLTKRPSNQNFVVAIMSYKGFNLLDAIVLNKGAVERGLGRSSYLRTYEAMETRYPGGQIDRFEIPKEDAVGYMGEEAYKSLGADGLANLESYADSKTVIAGRTSPPRFIEEVNEFELGEEKRRESSVTVRSGKPGNVDKIFITEAESGNKLVKIKLRSNMVPATGDKFSSKHGQKGVVGAIIPEEDMPFTAEGIRPDLILNPHSIPSRMTIGHLIEMLGGKASALDGRLIDGTPFSSESRESLGKILHSYGLRNDGKEAFYDGVTGEKIYGEIFTGIVAYRRLFHMSSHKIQARARGPVQILTRQPTEGKEKEGGLRFGEMEGETLIGHGAAMLLHEKLIEDSDKTVKLVCEKCGVIGVHDMIRNKKQCPLCNSTKVYPVEMSYGFKLLLDELKALGVLPKLKIADKVE
ncbi:MAG: DNA-directed RNA polymerase subunit B [Candidatus Diapherotrites archaeon]|nr:DNA-directed RNA polymerase subunit B [Candidatus Diapherotrites archaeon]